MEKKTTTKYKTKSMKLYNISIFNGTYVKWKQREIIKLLKIDLFHICFLLTLVIAQTIEQNPIEHHLLYCTLEDIHYQFL